MRPSEGLRGFYMHEALYTVPGIGGRPIRELSLLLLLFLKMRHP